MITVILPGYSRENESWLKECAEKLSVEGVIRPIYWDHWTEFGKRFDAGEKAAIVADVARDEPLNIVAKSIGTLVSSKVILENSKRINKVIFCGIPYGDLTAGERAEISLAVKRIPQENFVCYQKSGDPHGNFEDVSRLFKEEGVKATLIKKDGADHNYPFFEDFQNFLDKK